MQNSPMVVRADERAAHGRTLWWALQGVMILVICLPFWIYPYFPSQDGPSHLHNADVLSNYAKIPIYQEYYEILPISPAGNALSQYLLAGMQRIFPVRLMERIFLTAYVCFFCLAFRYLLGALTAYAYCCATFSGILVINWFVFMGFWNFCLSLALMMLVAGYFIRRVGGGEMGAPNRGERKRVTDRACAWDWRALSLLLLAGLALYALHAIGWMFAVLAFAAYGLPPAIKILRSGWREERWRACGRAVFQYAVPIILLTPPAVLLFAYLHGTHGTPVSASIPVAARERLWGLYSLNVLNTITEGDRNLSRITALVLAISGIPALVTVVVRRRVDWRLAATFGTCVLFCLAQFTGPDSIGQGTYIHDRLAFGALLFLTLCLACACAHWPAALRAVVCALPVLIACSAVVTRDPAIRKVNAALAEYVSVADGIRPGSTVMTICLNKHMEARVNPYLHAIGLLSPRPFVDLQNYEARADHFTTRFRTNRTPLPALGSSADIDQVPTVFSIQRYERVTHGRVDYVLCYGSQACLEEPRAFVRSLIGAGELDGFTRIRSTRSPVLDAIVLFERVR